MSTKIEWTDATWNPVTGCTKVSQGCKNCYAERIWPKVEAAERKRTIFEWEKAPKRAFTDVRIHMDRLTAPLHWAKGKRIFVDSMSDLFHEAIPFEFIADVFAVMSCTTRHQYQVLTKRPQRMLEFFAWLKEGPLDTWGDPDRVDPLRVWPQWTPSSGNRGGYDNCGPTWPCENVWLGVSAEDQATADERIRLLQKTPAAVRFLSCEPLLGPMDIARYLIAKNIGGPGEATTYGIDWVIAGGESGPKARPSHPDWFRSLRDQCAAADVPFFFKQWGEWGSSEIATNTARSFKVIEEHGMEFGRFGKKLNGRTLDGITHDAYP